MHACDSKYELSWQKIAPKALVFLRTGGIRRFEHFLWLDDVNTGDVDEYVGVCTCKERGDIMSSHVNAVLLSIGPEGEDVEGSATTKTHRRVLVSPRHRFRCHCRHSPPFDSDSMKDHRGTVLSGLCKTLRCSLDKRDDMEILVSHRVQRAWKT